MIVSDPSRRKVHGANLGAWGSPMSKSSGWLRDWARAFSTFLRHKQTQHGKSAHKLMRPRDSGGVKAGMARTISTLKAELTTHDAKPTPSRPKPSAKIMIATKEPSMMLETKLRHVRAAVLWKPPRTPVTTLSTRIAGMVAQRQSQ